MSEDTKDTQPEMPAVTEKPKPKRATKKAAPKKAVSYVVAPGKGISVRGRVLGEGQSVSADDVYDVEALIKGGYVIKA